MIGFYVIHSLTCLIAIALEFRIEVIDVEGSTIVIQVASFVLPIQLYSFKGNHAQYGLD
jgi:hypothetical protein